ncbi:c-type cytochrome [Magnetospirillum sulfuroxidans]|uniref:C-type cytochrome n=1 Tax=Magnetospirillum sulfuroxidans TaxID=611300 RepID=A0ABS5I993_9PROT|nr:c-type cytochrome [Magnetospirillum sulfuroxidans]MBR9970298.1 c-type cytochrome [Magnetospirillum sulfuroxidans]
MRGFLTTPGLCLAFALAAAPMAASAADAVTVMADSCAGCHGTDGHSIGGMPAFSGKKADELKKVLHDFKSGAREATVMDRIAKAYSVEQLDAIADYFASRKK